MNRRSCGLAARAFAAGSSLLLVMFLSGCGKRTGISVEPVRGQVIYKGQPVGGALVMFKPKSDAARVASGYTRDDGTFELLTSGASENGAMPGEYDVLISKVVEVDGKGNPVKFSPQDYNPAAGPKSPMIRKSLIPEKYNAPRSPLLSTTVTEDNNFVFDLKD